MKQLISSIMYRWMEDTELRFLNHCKKRFYRGIIDTYKIVLIHG